MARYNFIFKSAILLLHILLFWSCSAESVEISSSRVWGIPIVPLDETDLKVVILDPNPSIPSNVFYVRASYNKQKDVILMYNENYNGTLTPSHIYMGGKWDSDSDIMTEEHIVVRQTDSTAPLSGMYQYWCLYGQHGYLVPTFDNTDIGMTAADVGSVWADQLGRTYTIGSVDETNVILLPVFESNVNSRNVRRWQTRASTPIQRLSHVGGGVFSTDITPTIDYTQLYPVMQSQNRAFYLDGKLVTEAGTFHTKSFEVRETQIGFDPSTVTSWFPSAELTNARPMARFTWSYKFCGAQCRVNTTVDILHEVQFQRYCATQQQTFLDTGDYKAMFMIPKATAQRGVQLDRPFHSPSLTSPEYFFYRTPQYLKNIDQPVDRLVAFLHNDATDDYLMGMAAGLSLVSGDTQTDRRLANFPIGDDSANARMCLFSPVNTNKFYISAITSVAYADDDFYVPAGYHRDINYYVCFFDPTANEGQVYWYKDDDRYVIYAHCQTPHSNLAIQLPDMMNGCVLQVVEQSAGVTLLSSKITDDRIFVNYTDAANFIVLIAQPQ